MKELDLNGLLEFINELSDYIVLQNYSQTFAQLKIEKDVKTDSTGENIIPPGYYLIDIDSNIYSTQIMNIAPLILQKVQPLKKLGENIKLANLIFYIGEFNGISQKANAIISDFFPQQPGASTLGGIRLPDEIVRPFDRVTRLFFNNALGTEKLAVETKKKGSKTQAAPEVQTILKDLPPGVQLSRSMEPIDNAVFTAICSLWAVGTKRFTGHDLHRVITGNKNAIATDDKLKEYEESFIRLTSVQMNFDTGNVGDVFGFKRWIRNRRVVEGGRDTIIVQNQHGRIETTIYSILEEPTLKMYADALKQIGRFPIAVLNTPVNKTSEIITMQNDLLEYIYDMNRPGKQRRSNHILYETLFQKIEFPQGQAGKNKRNKFRQYVRKILNYWKDTQPGLLTDWKEEKKGGEYYCIIIEK